MSRLTHTLVDYSVRAFVERRLREFKRAAQSEAESSVAALLDAGRFERNRLTPLAARSRYAVAFKVLAREGKLVERQIAAMTAPLSDTLQPFRLAIAFGVISARCGPEPFGIAELRQIKTEAAACALAACGIILWETASRRVRAVFALRDLIGSCRS